MGRATEGQTAETDTVQQGGVIAVILGLKHAIGVLFIFFLADASSVVLPSPSGSDHCARALLRGVTCPEGMLYQMESVRAEPTDAAVESVGTVNMSKAWGTCRGVTKCNTAGSATHAAHVVIFVAAFAAMVDCPAHCLINCTRAGGANAGITNLITQRSIMFIFVVY